MKLEELKNMIDKAYSIAPKADIELAFDDNYKMALMRKLWAENLAIPTEGIILRGLNIRIPSSVTIVFDTCYDVGDIKVLSEKYKKV